MPGDPLELAEDPSVLLFFGAVAASQHMAQKQQNSKMRMRRELHHVEKFVKTLENLQEGERLAGERSENVLTIAGLAGLFKMCFEQAWQLMRRVLDEEGFLEATAGSPVPVIKLAYREHMINDEAGWRKMLDMQRIAAETWNLAADADIARSVPQFLQLFWKLRAELENRWLMKNAQSETA